MPTALRVLAVVGAACVLLGTASAFESRAPQAPNYYDTVGTVNFQGGHSCKTRPTVGSTHNEEEVSDCPELHPHPPHEPPNCGGAHRTARPSAHSH